MFDYRKGNKIPLLYVTCSLALGAHPTSYYVDTDIPSLRAEVEIEWNSSVIPRMSLEGVEREEFIFKLSLDILLFYLETNLWSIICMK